MATTNLMPLHPGKDGSIAKAFQRIIGYVENPEKTNDGSLVTAYAAGNEQPCRTVESA